MRVVMIFYDYCEHSLWYFTVTLVVVSVLQIDVLIFL